MHFPTVIGTFLLSTLTSAHFVLNYPTSLGFDDDNEPNSPCGGEDVVFSSNDTSVSVSGFPVALLTTHPQGTFTFRGTLDQQAPFNWTDLTAISEMGAGHFCLPSITVPSNWTGSSGLIQIIGNLPDGILYQCAAVKFVSGPVTTVDSNTCKNDSITATTIPAGNGSTTATTSASTTTPTKTSAASSLTNGAFIAGLGAVMILLVGGL